LKELTDWLNEQVAPDPVLANMGVSASIAAYGKCAVVLHPKFEDPSIRARMQTYGELLFGADEAALRDWMDGELDTGWYVYAKGEFASVQPEYQMRYFVDRMDPPESVPAWRFEREDDSLTYFTKVWGNRKYTVYRVLRRSDEAEARALARRGWEAVQRGALDEAEELAARAVSLDRRETNALRVLRVAGSLRTQGVAVEPAVP
jgi:hypothetical protein